MPPSERAVGGGNPEQPESPQSPEEAPEAAAEKSPSDDPPTVPENEIEIYFVRSSGPGGQKVNKTSSKAQLRWCVGRSTAFTAHQKDLIRRAAGNRLNSADEIVMSEQTERSQPQNRDAVIARLQRLVAEALTPQTRRIPTKPSWGEKQRRLDDKRRQGEKKQGRREPKGGW